MSFLPSAIILAALIACVARSEAAGARDTGPILQHLSLLRARAQSAGLSLAVPIPTVSEVFASVAPTPPGRSNNFFSSVVDQQLEPWAKRGIKANHMKLLHSMSEGAHYQIIGGKLFRTPDCYAEDRARGVEHFIARLAPELPDMVGNDSSICLLKTIRLGKP